MNEHEGGLQDRGGGSSVLPHPPLAIYNHSTSLLEPILLQRKQSDFTSTVYILTTIFLALSSDIEKIFLLLC